MRTPGTVNCFSGPARLRVVGSMTDAVTVAPGQTSSGNDMNGYADDPCRCDRNSRFAPCHPRRPFHRRRGSRALQSRVTALKRVAKAVLIAAVPPLMFEDRRQSRKVNRWMLSTRFARVSPRIVHSSTKTWQFSSTAPIGRGEGLSWGSSINSGLWEHAK